VWASLNSGTHAGATGTNDHNVVLVMDHIFVGHYFL
jgi:hypothetical protein